MKKRNYLIDDIQKIMADGPYVSTKDMVRRVTAYFKDDPILQEIRDGQLASYSFTQVSDDVEALGEALIEMGLEGRHIAISADNSYRFVVSYLSVCGGVGVAVPVDKDAPEQHFATLLAKGDVQALICSAHMLKKAQYAKEVCPLLETIIAIDGEAEGFESYDKLIVRGLKLAQKGIIAIRNWNWTRRSLYFLLRERPVQTKALWKPRLTLLPT